MVYQNLPEALPGEMVVKPAGLVSKEGNFVLISIFDKLEYTLRLTPYEALKQFNFCSGINIG